MLKTLEMSVVKVPFGLCIVGIIHVTCNWLYTVSVVSPVAR